MLCTQTDLETRVSPEKIKLWAMQRSSSTPDGDVITDAITWATEEVYTPLRALYAEHIPFESGSQPVVLTNIAVAFAIWWLASRHSEYSEIYRLSYEDALKQLKQIASGDIPLILPDGTELLDAEPQTVLTSGYARSTTTGVTPVFTRSTLTEFTTKNIRRAY